MLFAATYARAWEELFSVAGSTFSVAGVPDAWCRRTKRPSQGHSPGRRVGLVMFTDVGRPKGDGLTICFSLYG